MGEDCRQPESRQFDDGQVKPVPQIPIPAQLLIDIRCVTLLCSELIYGRDCARYLWSWGRRCLVESAGQTSHLHWRQSAHTRTDLHDYTVVSLHDEDVERHHVLGVCKNGEASESAR